MGQGYWPSSTLWGAPPGGQAPPPFGSPPWRTPLRPTTSTPPTVRQAYVKIGFVYLLDYFAFLTHSFTCLSRRLRITTRRRAEIQLHWCPLEPDGRIWQQRWWQWCDVIVLLSFVFEIVLSCQTCFTMNCRELYWMSCCCMLCYIFYLFWRLPVRGGSQNR
jgi:hypothetical protein